MGGCLSSGRNDLAGREQKATANVVSANGDLRRYEVPITVSQVLQTETETESESTSSPSFFICSSDRLYYNDYIPALDLADELEGNEIYFVLPIVKLRYKLSASDMAALAVKATIALDTGSRSKTDCKTSFFRRRSNKKNRVLPVVLKSKDDRRVLRDEGLTMKSSGNKSAGLGVSRSSSVRKLQRNSSRRARLAVPSFRLRLTTIFEGSVL